ncbi:TniQ family protein [Streptomyces sp. NBC_00728]|uniref:TniQ family protein n=1 Tax=Streptomyces sp. NBC_00728 TaxID=2903676 RepID=UPI00386F38D2
MVRSLPIRVEPLEGEALDSWLEALAARLSVGLADLTNAVGLPRQAAGKTTRDTPRWTVLLRPQEAASLAQATGTTPQRLAQMTLERWRGHVVEIDTTQRLAQTRTLWGRARGSRFCPRCLAETDGRWQLAWRLSWTFLCTRHHALLADTCPVCRRIPRHSIHPLNTVPRPGLCPAPAGLDASGRRARCRHPYAATATEAIDPGSPLEETQHYLNSLLTTPDVPVGLRLYDGRDGGLQQLLHDLKTLGGKILSHGVSEDADQWCPPRVRDRFEEYGEVTNIRNQQADPFRNYAPTDAAATAVAVTAALHILKAGPIRSVGQAAEWLTERVGASGRALYPASFSTWGTAASPTLAAALRCSREAHLTPLHRLRHRTATGAATRRTTVPTARANHLPAALWADWTLRLAPHHPSGLPLARRADQLLALACLMTGSTTSVATASGLLGPILSRHTLSNFLTDLTSRDDCIDVLLVITALADHLDAHGSPIDYARRRAIFGPREIFLGEERWIRLQKTLRSNPAGSHLHAQRWLFQTLTGSPIDHAHPGLAPATAAQYGYYQRFRWRLLPAEAGLLHQRAHELLDAHHIDEPLQWSPRLRDERLETLILPGPDPHSITPDQVQRLDPTGAFSIAQLAKNLGTTTAHARYLLAEHPVAWSPPRYRQTQDTAKRAHEWRSWYENEGLSLQAIADRAHVSPAAVRLALRKQGVVVRKAGGRPAYPDRLPEVVHRREVLQQPIQQIAEDTGISVTTIRNMLARLQHQSA